MSLCCARNIYWAVILEELLCAPRHNISLFRILFIFIYWQKLTTTNEIPEFVSRLLLRLEGNFRRDKCGASVSGYEVAFLIDGVD
jgi:hypothetical protein